MTPSEHPSSSSSHSAPRAPGGSTAADDAALPRPPATYLAPYQAVVDREGPTFAATLWYDRNTQETRFAVLAGLVRLHGLRLLDAGCGLGDLKSWLDREGVEIAHYIGIDGLDSVIDAARQRGFAQAEFHAVDFVADPSSLATGAPDLIFFSGSLNTVPEAQARAVVEHAFRVARRGVAFNFLSDQCSPERQNADTGPARRFNTRAWLEWAFSRTPLVSFRQDYFRGGHDATIVMLRGG